MFDIHLLPINLIAGKEQPDLPGFWVTRAPKRCDRSRAKDIIIMHCAFNGDAPINEQIVVPLLEKISAIYYQTRGSTTAAMRKVCEELNNELLKKNLEWKIGGSHAIGLFTLMVQKDAQLFLAQSGPTHSYHLNRNEVTEFYQPEQAGQGLGLSRTYKLVFSQFILQPNDMLLILPKPDKRLQSKHLQGSSQTSVEQLRKRVLSLPDEHLDAAILVFKTGTGKIERIQTDISPATGRETPVRPPSETIRQASPVPTVPAIANPEAAAPIEPIVPSDEPLPESIPSSTPELVSDRLPDEQHMRQAALSNHAEPIQPSIFTREVRINGNGAEHAPPKTFPSPNRKTQRARQDGLPSMQDLKHSLAVGYFKTKKIKAWLDEKLGPLAARLLPDKLDEHDTLTPTRLLLIAITVPVLIAIIASTIYFQIGQREQHQLYLLQAQKYASQAAAASDATLLRNTLEQSMFWLNKSEDYRVSDASSSLRSQIQSKLDQLDNIYHLPIQPAILHGLPANVEISEIVPNTNDTYLLDRTQGRVIRLFLTGQGFELDSTFNCGPGITNAVMINKLVDIVALPPNNPFNATVMGIDDVGNLLYCIPGKIPVSQTLNQPESGWGNITAITMNLGNLYILDTANNAVWLYYGDNFSYTDQARFFFDKVVPDIRDVVDIALNVDELFLLHGNGGMTTCTFRAYSQAETLCDDPALYGDIRPGKPGEIANFGEAKFSEVLTTQPPDASLYMLDENKPSLYHFSLRLNLQRILIPQIIEGYPEPKQLLSSFGITTNRLLLLAYGNQLFYTQLP
jgi:hypothetical protein